MLSNQLNSQVRECDQRWRSGMDLV